MSFETFVLCIEAVNRSANPEFLGKKFVWLNHFGEPLLNPLLPEFVAYAVSKNVEVSFATSGVDHNKRLFPRPLWQDLAKAGLKAVMLSAHAKSQQTLQGHIADIIPIIWSWQPKRDQLHDWAGQVNLDKLAPCGVPPASMKPCDYESQDMFAVRWDGGLAACCYDIEGGHPGDIAQVLEKGFEFRRIPLCSGCTLGRGDGEWIVPHPRLTRLLEADSAR